MDFSMNIVLGLFNQYEMYYSLDTTQRAFHHTILDTDMRSKLCETEHELFISREVSVLTQILNFQFDLPTRGWQWVNT